MPGPAHIHQGLVLETPVPFKPPQNPSQPVHRKPPIARASLGIQEEHDEGFPGQTPEIHRGKLKAGWVDPFRLPPQHPTSLEVSPLASPATERMLTRCCALLRGGLRWLLLRLSAPWRIHTPFCRVFLEKAGFPWLIFSIPNQAGICSTSRYLQYRN